MKKVVVWLCIVIIFVSIFLMQKSGSSSKNEDILHESLTTLFITKNIPIIDIRTPKEWQETGIIPGSHLITFYNEDSSYDEQKFLSAVEAIAAKDSMLLILCRSGNRSNKVAHFLFLKGFSHVINLSGGINEAIKNHIQTIPYQSH